MAACIRLHADQPLLKNEAIVFSFYTKSSSQVVLAKDTSNKYIVYRFMNKGRIEMEFPERDTGSWKKFKYSFYLRGGGPGNEGMDLNYFFFDNENYRYVIYDTYTSAGSKNSIGVKVINVDTGVTTDIPGKVNTRQGSLTDFRDNSLVEISEELFD